MKKLSTRQLLIIVVVIDIVLCGAFVFVNLSKNSFPTERQISESNIQRICELATLDCFYHNVTEWSDPGNIIGYGARKLWIEYDGIVRVGMKADQIKISEPDSNNVVTVTIPDAVILDKDLDESTVREIDSQTVLLGFIQWSEVNTEDRRKALSKAQDEMADSASQNGTILAEAKNRAKMIIETNIVAAGEAAGKHYKVKFVNASEAQLPSGNEDNQ